MQQMNFYCRSYCLFNMFRGTIMPIIRCSRVLYRWLLPVVLVLWLKTKAPNTTGSDHLYNTLELLMMGIMVPRNMLNKQ